MIIPLKDTPARVTRPAEVYAIIQTLLASEDQIDQDKEHFWVFQLDSRYRIKLLELVALGTLNASMVHPREVFTRAVVSRCCGIIVVHNHPSGDPTLSAEDQTITQRLRQAGEILDIPLHDHVIVGKDHYISFKE